ncbi:hypothetical protein MLD38_003701 [Melastoma candidum]|uniref:Uncharacterized protein n=1 Tax=Melastoma candidum TaxID=119954 RepID=A0ACB9S348_9MYRT|nr:hypothetical protein MLD38_003701 [Melastoma candidum]
MLKCFQLSGVLFFQMWGTLKCFQLSGVFFQMSKALKQGWGLDWTKISRELHGPGWTMKTVQRLEISVIVELPHQNLADASNIQDLVDIEVFLEARKVFDALQKKEVGPALAWCSENKSRLKKSKSILEFQLRLQEFVELVRAENNNMQVIAYARKYLAPWGVTHMKELQRVLATLAFKGNTEFATYKAVFEPKQWDFLVDQFRREFCRLYGITLEPLLSIFLQAGLSALKTALEEMAKKNDGKITCPRSGYVCNYSDLVKAFIS